MTEASQTVHFWAWGRVQGVGYRAFVEVNAAELGINGWVRNRYDGSVEAVFQGSPESVAEMIDRCRQGPQAATVTSVEVHADETYVAPRFIVGPTF